MKTDPKIQDGQLPSFFSGDCSKSARQIMDEPNFNFTGLHTAKASNKKEGKLVFFCTSYLICKEVPGAPSPARVVDSGSRSVNLSWSPPSNDGNAPVSSYRVLMINSTDSWLNVGGIRSVEVGVPHAHITGLLPSSSYLVRVVALNAVGLSSPTNELTLLTDHEPPTQPPTNVRVAPVSSTSLRITWQPPEDTPAQQSGLGYYVGYKVGNSSEPFRYKDLESTSASLYRPELMLTDLQKYTSYAITVQAYNTAGVGPISDPITATTQEDGAAGALTSIFLSITFSNITAFSKFLKSSQQTFFSLFKNFPVIRCNGSRDRIFHDYSLPSELSEKSVTTLSSQLMGLRHYTNYSITVNAYTRRGDGLRSDPIFCITHEDVPGPVERLKALSVDGQSILVSWLPPEAPNGQIIKYTLHMDQPQQPLVIRGNNDNNWGTGSSSWDNGNSWNEIDNDANGRSWVVSGSERQYLVTGLTVGSVSRYSFYVVASTTIGDGPIGLHVNQVPSQDAPAAIASFSDKIVSVYKEEIRLPCHVIGNPAPTRTWAYNSDEVVSLSGGRVREVPDGSLLIADIKASDFGNYSCRASNIHGSDAITYQVKVHVPPMTPLVYVSDVTSNTLTVRWRNTHDGGIPVLGYYLYMKREFGEWRRVEVPAEADSYTLTGLQCGSRYQVYVTAYNHVGTSDKADSIPTKTLGRSPIVPAQSSFIRVNMTSITLNLASWLNGGCPITSIVVEY
ncbi:unnamed protein product, partial [Meganyctiphanes norvegica]